MAIRVDIKLETHARGAISRFDARFKQAQAWLDNEVLKNTEPYTPFRTGMLARSGPGSTQMGSGIITYDTPYARRMYYGNYNFSKAAHPLATSRWFEKSKAVNRDKWLRGVEKIIKG